MVACKQFWHKDRGTVSLFARIRRRTNKTVDGIASPRIALPWPTKVAVSPKRSKSTVAQERDATPRAENS
jgi:hypothetical protein